MARIKELLLFVLITHSALLLAKEESAPATIAYQYALYLNSSCIKDPKKEALAILNGPLGNRFSLVNDFKTAPVGPVINVGLFENVQQEYAPPGVESAKRFGHGLDHEDAVQLQKLNNAIFINVAYPQTYIFSAMLDALKFTEQLAIKCGGYLWDEETREIFTIDAWRQSRIDTWLDGRPDASKHITIHAYKNPDYVRAISLGMAKFLMPDIVINDFSQSDYRRMGSLINLVTQTLVEGEELADDWGVDINVSEIKHPSVNEKMVSSMFDNASKSTRLMLSPTKPEEGDPNNFLLEVDFSKSEGKTLQAKQNSLVANIFGWQDQISYVKHNQKIDVASAKARKQLPRLKKKFVNGLPTGDYLHVKAPFKTPDGSNEWMWVEVVKWSDKEIEGLLQNVPFNIPDLKVGSEVIIYQGDIFDYTYHLSNGESEGNTTGKLIQEYQISQQTKL